MTEPANVLAAWTAWLTETRFLNNTILQWGVLLGALLAGFIFGKIVSFAFLAYARRTETDGRPSLLGMILRSLAGPITLILLAIALYVAGGFLTLSYVETLENGEEVTQDWIEMFWYQVCDTVIVLAAGWFIFRLVDVIELLLSRWAAGTQTLLDDQLIPVLRKSLRVFVVIVAALFIAQNIFQWDIGALIAGLGIGGLAVALAAQDALSNFFGSVSIFVDRPFQIGDWVRIGEFEGVIEEVGFRSTRLRTFAGTLVTIPNSHTGKVAVDNVQRRPYIRRNLNVTVTYDTPPEKIERGIGIIREMLDTRSGHFPDDRPPKVLFSDFNAASLNILVVYWYAPPDWWEYQAFNHDFNMELLRRFNDEGVEFAFPTQTLYLKQDSDFQAEVALNAGGGHEQAGS